MNEPVKSRPSPKSPRQALASVLARMKGKIRASSHHDSADTDYATFNSHRVEYVKEIRTTRTNFTIVLYVGGEKRGREVHVMLPWGDMGAIVNIRRALLEMDAEGPDFRAEAS